MIISFEGLDGCGKSTQIELTARLLREHGRDVRILREPGGNAVSEKIRGILLDLKNCDIAPETELLLYIASRTQLVRKEIASLEEKGCLVILDRFIDSTAAYQGYGRGLDKDIVTTLNLLATAGGKFYPSLTIFLDITVNSAFDRIKERGEEKNRMESAGRAFFERVRNGFLELAEQDPERIETIDAGGSVDEVFKRIKTILKMRKII